MQIRTWISVINATHQELKSVIAKARIIDYSMKECWAYTDTISVGADQYKELETVPQRGDPFCHILYKAGIRRLKQKSYF